MSPVTIHYMQAQFWPTLIASGWGEDAVQEHFPDMAKIIRYSIAIDQANERMEQW